MQRGMCRGSDRGRPTALLAARFDIAHALEQDLFACPRELFLD